MNRRMQWIAGLVLMVLSATASAQTYEYLDYKMLNPPAYPFKYYIDARANTSGVAISESERVTKAAFATWELVSCAYPAFQYLGQTQSDVANPLNSINVSTIWVTSKSDPSYSSVLGGGGIYSGSTPLTYGGYLYQCDIYINAVDFRWSTLDNPDPRFVDLQTVLTHEIGHCMGLGDAFQPDTAVMYPNFPLGTARRALDAQDVKQFCDYYPQDNEVGSPCSVSDPCGGSLTCTPFTNSSGQTLYSYCTKGCNGLTNGECPLPFACRASSAVKGFTKACLAVPGEAITQVGKACNPANDPGIECGSPRAFCQGQGDLPSGGQAWVDGYCFEECEASSATSTCPTGSVCVEFGAKDRCLKSCRPGTADCRAGYTCSPQAQGNVCVPNCYSSEDCNDGSSPIPFVCDTCTHICIENKISTRSVGDPCSKDNECGTGQFCYFINNNPQGICTQTCALAQCGCPLDSTCKSVGPDRVCMKNCATGTCPFPLECNPVADSAESSGYSTSCTPACTKRTDCPTGFDCYGGRCLDPTNTPDAGCTLCSDGGNPPPPPPPTDGGSGNGNTDPPSGCGCGEAPGSALMLFGVLALVLFSGRRRSWPQR